MGFKLVLLGSLICGGAMAQVSSGDLTGAVTDPAGAVVPGATVTASDAAHGIIRSAVSDTAGQYRIGLLPPGVYRVRVEATGFGAKIIDGIAIRVGDIVVADARLEVGGISSEVTVEAEAP